MRPGTAVLQRAAAQRPEALSTQVPSGCHLLGACTACKAQCSPRPWYLGLQVIALLLVRATVHHVDDVVDGDGGLSDVGGQDDLPDARRRPLEDVLLVHHGDVGVHWQGKAESALPC